MKTFIFTNFSFCSGSNMAWELPKEGGMSLNAINLSSKPMPDVSPDMKDKEESNIA